MTPAPGSPAGRDRPLEGPSVEGPAAGGPAAAGVLAGGSAPSFPIMLRLEGRPVLVVGGGTVAAAKARLLLDAGAVVTMVATRYAPEALALEGPRLVCRPYRRADLDGTWLVVTAIDDAAQTAAIAADAEAARIFCNAADRPESCSATLMATLRDGPVTVAVSTSGQSPAAAAWLRDRIGGALGGRASALVAVAATARRRLRQERTSEGLPWGALLDEVDAAADESRVVEAVDRFVAAAIDGGGAAGGGSAARGATGASAVAAAGADGTGAGASDAGVAADGDGGTTAPTEVPSGAALPRGQVAPDASTPGGRVLLVGAGPGDPELLTIAAVRALGWADVVVHDALVGDAVFELVPDGVELIDVGKRPGQTVPQEMICSLLVDLAGQGRKVVRLKGGDPYVFGRGGEEALELLAAGVPFDVIPGVTSALAGPALAGVPVTHRGVSAAVTVVTGHRADLMAPVDWAAVARLGGTLVVLMGVTERGHIAAALMAGGMDPATPVATVQRASRPDQEVRRTTLARLVDLDVRPPATIVIGAVAGLDLRQLAADAEGTAAAPVQVAEQ